MTGSAGELLLSQPGTLFVVKMIQSVIDFLDYGHRGRLE